MGEWDGLESRLKDLGDEAARLVDDPLDPARVRGLADRRRLRRSVAAVADRGRHPRLGRGRRVRGHVPTGAAHTEPGRRSHQHADPESRAVGGDQRSRREDPERHVRARRPAAGATDLPVEQPVLPRSHPGVTDAVGDPLPVADRDLRGARARSRRPPGRRIRMRTRPRNRPAGAVAGRRRPPRRRATRPPAADARLRPAYATRRPVSVGSSIGSVSIFDRPTMQPPAGSRAYPTRADPIDERGATMRQRRLSKRSRSGGPGCPDRGDRSSRGGLAPAGAGRGAGSRTMHLGSARRRERRRVRRGGGRRAGQRQGAGFRPPLLRLAPRPGGRRDRHAPATISTSPRTRPASRERPRPETDSGRPRCSRT